MFQSVHDYWISFNNPLEGRVKFVYLDQKGWVSTGIGNKIDETAAANSAPSPAERAASLAEANELRWVDESDSKATSEQIAFDWDTVKSHLELAPARHLAFKPFTALHVKDAEIDRNVYAKADQMDNFLAGRANFADFAAWPANAQLATPSACAGHWGQPSSSLPSKVTLPAANGAGRPTSVISLLT